MTSEVEHRSLRNHLFREGSVLNGLLSAPKKRRQDKKVDEVQAWLGQDLDLRLGEWVWVRSMREIAATLDGKDALRGLSFMLEMERYCGHRPG